MSFKSNSNSNLQKKPFCKVCQDAGKPESEYTNHFVRSQPDHHGNTKVTCPTLNNTECRYCYKFGHTTKFCPVLAKNEKQSKIIETRTLKVIKPKVHKNKPKTCFDLLAVDDSDDESESPPVIQKKEHFPAMFGIKESTTSVAKQSFSYASMAEKPAAPPVYKQVAVSTSMVEKPHNSPVYKQVAVPIYSRKSWGYSSNSDNDDDDDDEW
jgi:hypothetical protein